LQNKIRECKLNKKISIGLLLGMAASTTAYSASTGIAAAEYASKNIYYRHPNLPGPATSIFAPVAYGPGWGVIYASGAYVNRWPGGRLSDGYGLIGMGFGDPDEYFGATVAVLIDSLGVRDEHFAQNTGVGGSAYSWITPDTSLAVGVSNFVGWGAFENTAYGVFTSLTQLIPLMPQNAYPVPMAVTVGVGSGNFVSPFEFKVNKHDMDFRPFGAIAISPIEQLSFIADFTQEVLSLGISAIPVRNWPILVTGYATNLSGPHTVAGGATYGVRVGVGIAFA